MATIPMPCPNCQRLHLAGEYVRQVSDGAIENIPAGTIFHAPLDVECPCGATLRVTVPFFNIDPEGWHWRIIKPAGVLDAPSNAS